MAVIDLREEEKKLQQEPKSYLGLVIFFLVISVLTAIGAFGGFFIVTKNTEDAISTKKIALGDVNSKILSLEADAEKALETQSKASYVQTMFDEHVCFSGVIDLLEDTTVDSVFYEGMELESTSGSLVLSAKAASYTDAADQIAIWRSVDSVIDSYTVSDVSLEKIVGSEQEFVSFQPRIVLNPDSYNCKKAEIFN